MANMAEIRAGIMAGLGKLGLETLGPLLKPDLRSLELKEAESASLERARKLGMHGRTWVDSVADLYTVFVKEPDPKIRIEAVVELSQMLINLGRYRQARQFLERGKEVGEKLEGNKKFYWLARVEEKTAWIDDYEGNFLSEISHLKEARTLLTHVPRNEWNVDEEGLSSTITHFTGRAHLGLAHRGVNRQANTALAIDSFKKDLARYIVLRDSGKPVPQGEGFNHGWLARCYILLGNLPLAEKEIEMARNFFGEVIEQNPKSGIMAHYHLLKGKLLAKKREIVPARKDFEESLRIRQEIEPYLKGETDGMMGIAWTYFAEGKHGAAFYYWFSAIKAMPIYLTRGFF